MKRFGYRPLVWLSLFAYTFFLDWGSLGFGLLSDQYVLFARLKGTFLHSLSWDGTWSYTPIVSAFNWLEIAVFGRHESGYQIIDVLLHVVLVILVFELGRRFLDNSIYGLLAALLFDTSASYYEVRYWPGAGTFYEMTAIFYVLAIISLMYYLADRKIKYQIIFLVFIVLAMLSDETGLSVVPVCGLYYLILCRPFEVRGTIRLFSLPVLFLLVYICLKLLMGESTTMVSVPDPANFIFYLNKAMLSLALARGDSDLLNPLAAVGGHPELYFIWLVAFALPLVAMAMKYRSFKIELFLAAWTLVELLMMDIGAGISVRHVYLPCIPFSLLVIALVGRATNFLFSRLDALHEVEKWRGAFLVLALMPMLLPGYSDLIRAQATFAEANAEKQSLIAAIASAPDQQMQALYILNPSASIYRYGFLAYLFQNGIVEMVEAYFPGRFSEVHPVYLQGIESHVSGSYPISPAELAQITKTPGNIVIEFLPTSGAARLIYP